LSLPLLLLAGFAALLLIVLIWVLVDPRKLAKSEADPLSAEDLDRCHVTYFPQVKQALAADDYAHLASREGSRALTRRVRKERRKIALAYMACLRGDFLKLWRLARVIASMSPRVGASQELERLRLGLAFSWRYEVLRIKILFGFAPIPELGSLSDVVSRLSIRLETGMKDLGERAALAAKLASSLDGRGLRTP
jgi:hypothetical protein